MKPYGANDEMTAWAKRHGLKYSPKARCLHWVVKGRCQYGFCNYNHNGRQWMDHASGWIDRWGGRMLLCQPYYLSDIQSLAKDCRELGMKAVIHSSGWYGYGTVAIELKVDPQCKHSHQG